MNSENKYDTWSSYLGDKSVSHYSSLNEIDTNNVQQLKLAWIYHTGDTNSAVKQQIQCNPIIVGDVLYGTSPQLKLFALNAATGKPIWIFDPFADTAKTKVEVNVNRGVTFWSDGNDKRIFYTAGSFLYGVDAMTGKLISSFGNEGRVDLHDGLDRNVKDLYVVSTSPGIIYKDLLIMGTRVAEGGDAAPGHIRAFEVHTGKRKWIFHTIPHPGEFGYDTWKNQDAWKYIGGANCWAGMSLDEKRGVVYIATGSPTFDFYGGFRKGQNLFANCVVALDAATGNYLWHFQTIHHDLWDRDPPAPPNLVTIRRDGKQIDAVAQITKTGYVFVLDRDNGKPLFPVNEMPVPHNSTLIGEEPWPTQPVPKLPKPFAVQSFSEPDINTLVPQSSQDTIRKKIAELQTGNLFLPPSEKGTVLMPGFDGGGEWGGAAYDPSTGYFYVNANQVPWTLTMVKVNVAEKEPQETVAEHGRAVYLNNCMACHGKNREGNGSYPTLQNVNKKYTAAQVSEIINNGRRMMPSFKQITNNDKKALLTFLLDLKKEGKNKFIASDNKEVISKTEKSPFVPYTMTGYNKLRTPEGYPANQPPWGTLTAINLNTGETMWHNPLGEYPELTKKGIPVTGTENYGGAVVTKGGLLFIAATSDGKLRAFNKRTGKLLWETSLPAAGFATPSTYEINGKQYLVIACGGGKLDTPSGDSYVAFALE
ncbi:MAG: outer membrane protein assembly factor BamB family protein [Ginsengibacter sp.]